MELLNLLNFIETQRQERYRAFIIWGEAMSGKTNFARQFAQAVGADYLDLLAHVAASPELKASIDLLDPMRLRDLLLHLPTQSQYVIIDNPDFLLNTWSDAQRREFFHIVEKLDNVQTDQVFCFVL